MTATKILFSILALVLFSSPLWVLGQSGILVSDSNQIKIPDIVAPLHDSLNSFVLLPMIPLDSLINYSRQYIGSKYKYGGKTESGFDCSGFVYHVFKNFGVELPPSSRSQVNVGLPVKNDSIQKGDLLFFKGRNAKSTSIGHVALVIDVSDSNDVQMIHSTRHGLKVDWLSEELYWKKRFVTTRRLKVDLQ